jgi:hypothetical protein
VKRLLLIVLAALALPASAHAAPVSIPGREGDGIAYAAGRVVWVEDAYSGEAVIRMRGPGGGARLGTVKLPLTAGAEVETVVAANASGYVVAFYTLHEDVVVRGAWGAAPETVLDCPDQDSVPIKPPLLVAAGATSFAVSGYRCGPPVQLVGVTGPPVPVPGLPAGYEVAYTEPFVATGTTGIDVDLRTGAHRQLASPHLIAVMSLLADGTIVAGLRPGDEDASDDPMGIYTWAPGADRPRLLAKRDYTEGLIAAGRTVFAETDYSLELLSLDGAKPRAVTAPARGSLDTVLGFDGRTAVFRDTNCDGQDETTLLDVTEPLPGVAGCPVQLRAGALRFGSSRRATLRVRCPNGCRADVEFKVVSTPGFCSEPPTDIPTPRGWKLCPMIATAKLRLAPSARVQTVSVRLNAAGVRTRARRHRLVVTANVPSTGLDVTGEGTRREVFL